MKVLQNNLWMGGKERKVVGIGIEKSGTSRRIHGVFTKGHRGLIGHSNIWKP